MAPSQARNLVIFALLTALAAVQMWRETRPHPESAWPSERSLALLAERAPSEADLLSLARETDPRDPPRQVDLPREIPGLRKLDHDLIPRAAYVVDGRVLAARRYRRDRAADLSPVDLAIGWGRMTEDRVLDELHISQRGRFYFYRWQGSPPIPMNEIRDSSANKHLLPVSRDIDRALKRVREGDRVRLRGWLVNVDGPRVSRWNTSMVRTDSGGGACEIMLVTDVERLPPSW